MTVSLSILQKIGEVTDQVPSLKKTERNDDARFNFVSIDVFYDQVARLANEIGLNWITVEEGIEIIPLPDGQLVVAQKFRFDLFDYTTGDFAEGYSRLTIPAPFSDAQTAGISLSYADKAFMRTAFKVVTGEKDADHYAKPRQKKAEAQAPRESNARQEPRQEQPQEPKEARQADPAPEPKVDKKKPGRPAKAKEEASLAAAEGSEYRAIADRLITLLDEIENEAGDEPDADQKKDAAARLAQFRVDEQGEINALKTAAANNPAAEAEKQRVQEKYSELYDRYEEVEE